MFKCNVTGGDWGAMLSKALGLYHSDHCKGIHINMLAAAPRFYNPWHILQMANAFLPYLDQYPIFATAQEISWLKDTRHFETQEAGRVVSYCVCCVPLLLKRSLQCRQQRTVAQAITACLPRIVQLRSMSGVYPT